MSRLAGRTVLVTRAADDAGEWVSALEARGARAVVEPCIVCRTIADRATAELLQQGLEDAACLALTSRRGVLAAHALLRRPLAPQIVLAAVGPATAALCRETFGRCEIVAPGGTAASLGDELVSRFGAATSRPCRVVVAAADRADRQLEAALEPRGIEVLRVTVYVTEPSPPRDPPLDLFALGIDAVFLASPSAVTGLVHRAVVPDAVRVITIGPSTTAAARRAGLHVAAEAKQPSLEGLVEALA